MTLRRLWQEMTTKDFVAVDREHAVAILPVAAIEQHGPHLPVVVDSCINQGLLDLALTMVPIDLPVTVLPMQMIGKSDEHIAFPGTLTLSAETLTRMWTEIGESVHRAGIRRLVLLNSHGGQPQIMDIVARDLRIRLDMFVVTASWSSFGLPPGIFPEAEIVHGIHGGAIETALMLHFRPDLVRHELLRDFPSLSAAMAGEYKHLSAEAYMAAEGGAGFGWMTQDLNPLGACGDATLGTAEKGREIAEFEAKRFVELLHEVSRFPLDRLKPGPG